MIVVNRKIFRVIYHIIEYNLLNLPSKVEFAGGNIIENIYAADGRKLSSYYLVQATQAQSPIERTLIIAKTTDKKAVNITDTPIKRAPTVTEIESGTHYIGNFEYLLGQNGVQETTRIHNAEGYYTEGEYFYYRRDHLGNNREVWNATQNTTVQKNDYYASGLPFEYITSQEQPYMYNGKEFVEFGGYDVTDLGNRGDYHAINRFTSMDRFCEKFPHQSPYCHAGNNPIRYIDVRGDSTTFTGGQEDITETENVINNGIGIQGTAGIGEDGLLSVNELSEADYNSLSPTQQAFYNIMREAATGAGMTTISVVNNSMETYIGNFDLNQIDIADIKAIGNGEGMNSYSVLAHEVYEQQMKQINGI